MDSDAKPKYERRLNTPYLVSGYSRENAKKTSLIPSSVNDLISNYFPSMNGHSFLWKVKSENIIKKNRNIISNDDEELKSPTSLDPEKQAFRSSLDSDVFDIGLSNKFFLRLESNIYGIQQSDSLYDPSRNRRGRGRGYNRRYNSNRRERGGDFQNSVQISSDPNQISATAPDDDENKAQTNRNNNNNNRRANEPPKVSILSLMSFPLPKNYVYEIFHVELYFHEMNTSYSCIWNQSDKDHRDSRYRDDDYYDYDDYPPGRGPGRRGGQSEDNTYVKHGWVIDYDINKCKLDQLTFECKINVLHVTLRNPLNYDKYGRGRGRGRYYRGRYGGPPRRNYYTKYNQNGFSSDEDEKEPKPYNYACLAVRNYTNTNTNNNKSDNTNTMRFTWNIEDVSYIDRLTGNNFYKGVIQFHSDVYYDIFQLQIGRESDSNYLQVQLCGLPQNTEKMSVKLQLYAMDGNGSNSDNYYSMNENNGIQVMSTIVTFSYLSPLYLATREIADILVDLLVKYRKLSILCVASVIHRYDLDGNVVKDSLFQTENIRNKHEDRKYDDEYDEDKLGSKWLNVTNDSFIWRINDDLTLKRVKSTDWGKINSKPFELLGNKWFITVHKPVHEEGDVLIVVESMINNPNIDIQGPRRSPDGSHLDTMIEIELSSANIKHLYYEQFDSHWNGGYFQRIGSHYSPSGSGEEAGKRCLRISNSKLKKLLDRNFSIKVTIGIINGYHTDNRINKQIDNGKENDVKVWLTDIVKLGEYYSLFKMHGIDEMDIVKLLTMDSIKSLGIKKIGHKLKILNEVKTLNEVVEDID